ncbi:hypothetical protein FNV43_RR06429 [Rhamnella rubrinervis]|uniref:Uncharacterized protein n=1 Tax=Rhamnella rubrinervis TaxID=2594499 RepID=A0A8K0MLE0_9ROSA|nr:hypothetical protein FNV43_RR06429 [Rhamnella rubrinervis]
MSRVRAFSSPELPSSANPRDRPEDHSFEGIATNVKLLLKLVQDHNEACTKDIDERRPQRVAGMISIIDDVKTRIQKSQTLGRKAELRRCNTDLRPHAPRDKKSSQEPIADEKERLRKELSASLAARKSLEVMCSSLGKEKEIMSSELARKVHELNETEELVNDLRAQNEMLLGKVQAYATDQKEKRSNIDGGETALQDRNKALSEQLLKSLDGYRSLKRKLKDAHEENMRVQTTMEEIGMEAEAALHRTRSLKERIVVNNEEGVDIGKEILALETLFQSFNMKISKNGKKKSDSPKANSEDQCH